MSATIEKSRNHLLQETRRLTDVIHDVSYPCLVVDADGVIRTVNPEFELILGFRESQVIGRQFASLLVDAPGAGIQADRPPMSPSKLGEQGPPVHVKTARRSTFLADILTLSQSDPGGEFVASIVVLREAVNASRIPDMLRETGEMLRDPGIPTAERLTLAAATAARYIGLPEWLLIRCAWPDAIVLSGCGHGRPGSMLDNESMLYLGYRLTVTDRSAVALHDVSASRFAGARGNLAGEPGALVGLPLFTHQEVFGALILFGPHPRPGPFEPGEIGTAQFVADLVAAWLVESSDHVSETDSALADAVNAT